MKKTIYLIGCLFLCLLSGAFAGPLANEPVVASAPTNAEKPICTCPYGQPCRCLPRAPLASSPVVLPDLQLTTDAIYRCERKPDGTFTCFKVAVATGRGLPIDQAELEAVINAIITGQLWLIPGRETEGRVHGKSAGCRVIGTFTMDDGTVVNYIECD